MKQEHYILFSTPMVAANMDGIKNQTRRTVKSDVNKNPDYWDFISTGPNPVDDNDQRLYAYFRKKESDTWFYTLCPYGNIGDIILVKETFYALGKWEQKGKTKKTGKPKYIFVDKTAEMDRNYMYLTHSGKPANIETKKDGNIHWYLRPSIFMPKRAIRNKYEIISVDIERLHDITPSDAINEGIERKNDYYKMYDINKYIDDPKYSYKTLWIKINGVKSWQLNQFVWVIKYKPL